MRNARARVALLLSGGVAASVLLQASVLDVHAATGKRRADDAVPAWLYPVAPAPASGSAPIAFDSVTPVHIPRSRVSFVESQLHNLFFAPDWIPSAHPVMPPAVAVGRRPATFACAYCHMPDGTGRPENVPLAGLPAAYIVQQVADMKSHARSIAWQGGVWVPFVSMLSVAEHATDAEVRIAAEYFSRLAPRARTRVLEARNIPKVRPVTGTYAVVRGAGTEALANRLIEAPVDFDRHEHRDPHVGYVAYVPVGSIARGRTLSQKPMNELGQVCGSCHGPALRGAGVVPPLAGLSPGYVVRQLLAFSTGARATVASAPMQKIAASMSHDDMIAVAAYVATLRP